MVQIARRDTYGIEDLGGGVRVRRRIVAGTPVPEHYEVDPGDVEERKHALTRSRPATVETTPEGVRTSETHTTAAPTEPEQGMPGAEAGHPTGPGTVAGEPEPPAPTPTRRGSRRGGRAR